MDHAVSDVAGLSRSARRGSKGAVLNWRLVLALGVNTALWGGIILGVKVLLD